MPRGELEFIGGAAKAVEVDTLPLGVAPRVAFAGRSNVGKSSLVNALTGARLARVSAEPGKTREMNFYRWVPSGSFGPRWVLVDLPGYGYAKVSKTLRAQWGDEITKWLKSEENLFLVVALVDGRHGYLPNDVELVEFLRGQNLPLLVAFTKMDKWKSANQRRQAEKELTEVSNRLGVADFIFVSAVAKDGVRPLERALKQR
jgi:GTP-binding protein